MKKTLLILFPMLAIGIFISYHYNLSIFNSDSFEYDEFEEEEEEGPGYFDFIREIKGVAPDNIVNIWASQVRENKNGTLMLDSVKELGPYNVGGRIRALVLDQSNPDRIFVGGISGGVWVSEQSGKAWTNLNDHEITLNVSYLTQSPLNPDVLYYCTGESSGNSSAAPGAGIFRSGDHGKTFSQLPSTANGTFDYAWRIACSPVDSHTVYVALNYGGLYRSKDDGKTFEKVVFTSNPVQDLELFDDGSVLISIKKQGVYKSPNGDDGTWTLLNSGLPSGSSYGRIELAYCESQPNIIYAAVSSSSDNSLYGLYRSNNGGTSWTATSSNPASKGGQFPYTWYCLAMDVNQNNPDQVIIGAVNLIYSNDGGSTWIKAGNSHSDYHVMKEHPSKPGKIYIGNDGGFYEYDWSGLNSFVDLNWGLNITQFYAGAYSPSGLTVMAGAQDNGTKYSLNGNETFLTAYGADGAYTQISQQDPSIAYVSYQNGMIYRVDEFGTVNQTTTKITKQMDADQNNSIDDGAWFINPFDINMQDGEMLFFPTKKKLYRSINGGGSYEPITNNLDLGAIQPFCVGVSNQKNPSVYVGGGNSLFYRIPNAGTVNPGKEVNLRTFVPRTLYSSFLGCIRVSPVNHSVLYLGYTNYSAVSRIWKVTEADSDTPVFVDISGNLPTNMPVNWVEVDPASNDSVLFAGTDRGLFYTSDGGQTWYQDERIPNVVVDMLRLRMSDRRLFIYTHGRGIFTGLVKPRNKSLPPYDVLGIAQVRSDEIVIYPNPAQNQVHIKWTSNNGDSRKVEIYSMQGKLVYSGHLSNDGQIETANWKPGIYLIKAEGMETRKLQVRNAN
ncbi:MAG: T9SS type A sorting domain-containing protein [Bacteroidetes bacterium]|nr:T9SS type A sorting domain-containing protein [Bacteroidota bacterium]